MTKEQKDLLKKVICAMLPYGVKATTTSNGWNGIYTITGYKDDRIYLDCPIYDEGDDEWLVESVKPYLRPMSSMTEEEKEYVKKRWCYEDWYDIQDFLNHYQIDAGDVFGFVDWLNENMFDYRGLIARNFAIEVTEDNNPYKS